MKTSGSIFNFQFSIFNLIIFLISFNLSAQNKQNEQKAKTILDEVSAKTKAYSTIKVIFNLLIENKDKKQNETHQGSLTIKGNKYKLDIVGQEIMSDGVTVWTYMKDANEVQIKNYEDFNSESDLNPSKLLTVYQQGFKFEYLKESVENGKAVETIDIFPLEPKKKHYSRIRLTVDKATKQITGSKSFGKDGGQTTISITKFVPNAPIDDGIFTFNKANYPGVEVVDLR